MDQNWQGDHKLVYKLYTTLNIERAYILPLLCEDLTIQIFTEQRQPNDCGHK